VRYDHYDYSKGAPKERAYYCNKCGGTVVYTTSASGKRFLCDAVKREYANRSRYGRKLSGSHTVRKYYPNLWHSKSCVSEWDGTIHPRIVRYREDIARLRDQENQTDTE
jgi:hypothetical protein